MTSNLLLMDKIQMELGALEPWPKDVRLYQPYEVEQILLPDNANCLAVQAFLRMCNLEFEVVCKANAEFMSPSGKVPFIKCGAFVISELEPIVQFVNTKGITLTENLESDQKADMRAYMSLVHNVLENAELYICWCDKETYNEVTKPRNGSVYPWPLNHFQTWTKKSAILKKLKMMGWYNKNIEQVYQEVENCCQALTDRLEGKEYFFGKRYTELDALVYGHVYSIILNSKFFRNHRLLSILKKYHKLIDQTKLIHQRIMNSVPDISLHKPNIPIPKQTHPFKEDPKTKVEGEPDLIPSNDKKRFSFSVISHEISYHPDNNSDLNSDLDDDSVITFSDIDTDEVLSNSSV